MPVEHFFDFAAGDVLAAGLDHVFLAVHDMQQSVPVVVAEIAGVKPATGECLGGSARVVEVAQHQMRTPVGDLTDLTGAERNVVVVEDRGFDVDYRTAGRPGWVSCSSGPSADANGAISVWP